MRTLRWLFVGVTCLLLATPMQSMAQDKELKKEATSMNDVVKRIFSPYWDLSLHGGLRAIRFGGEVKLAGWGFGPALDGYGWTGSDDWGLGYVLGGAYEIPEIALRVALTWGSATEIEVESVETHVLDPASGSFGTVRSRTDITMPHIGGRALADRLVQQYPSLAVIFMSGHRQESLVENGRLDSDVLFLQKPFSRDALAHTIRAALEGRPSAGHPYMNSSDESRALQHKLES